ncbi:MAG TPA: FtsQ-type POTRA domain-containing protein [Patescibacteria group bacterium]|nr:FtsQ-type POTRA domain-containing protein [Patescibacteria group bacterium]
MKIFSKHRKKLEPHRRFGSREFQSKLTSAKNYKRNLGLKSRGSALADIFSKTGLSKAGTFAALLVLAGIIYFAAFSPYFLVKDINVSGNSRIPSQTIVSEIDSLSQKRFFLVPENSLLFLSQGRLSGIFKKNLPDISEVILSRHWPDKISLQVTERNPSFVLSATGENFLVDDQGFVIRQVVQNPNLLQVADQVSEDVSPGSTIGGKIVPFIVSMQKQWPGKITIPIASAKIPGKAASEVEFVSTEGWSVLFSTDLPVATQLDSLQLLLSRQITPANRAKLSYIDLRLAKWAYYCYKDTPCQQTSEQSQAAIGPQAPVTGSSTRQTQNSDTSE